MLEKDFNTMTRNSVNELGGKAYKISDIGGFATGGMTVASTTDIYGVFRNRDGSYSPVYIEGKFNSKPMSFNLNRVETHQADWLDWYAKIPDAKVFLTFGMHAGRGDVRAYVFDWRSMGHRYYDGFSFTQKILAGLPYNKVSKGLFAFDSIISDADIEKAINITKKEN